MTDWTVIATTLGASAITGTVGYLSAWWHGRISLEQAQMENERLRIQHREDHLRNRQATYHEFLDEAATWERTAETTRHIFEAKEPSDAAKERLDASDRRFRHLLNGVLLFGTNPVRQAAKQLQDIQSEITVEWWTRLGNEHERDRPRTESVGTAFPTHRHREWEQALERLIDAMRNDVAPD